MDPVARSQTLRIPSDMDRTGYLGRVGTQLLVSLHVAHSWVPKSTANPRWNPEIPQPIHR